MSQRRRKPDEERADLEGFDLEGERFAGGRSSVQQHDQLWMIDQGKGKR
jgi:hypothetical protein